MSAQSSLEEYRERNNLPSWLPLFVHRIYAFFILAFLFLISWGGLFLQIAFYRLKFMVESHLSEKTHTGD